MMRMAQKASRRRPIVVLTILGSAACMLIAAIAPVVVDGWRRRSFRERLAGSWDFDGFGVSSGWRFVRGRLMDPEGRPFDLYRADVLLRSFDKGVEMLHELRFSTDSTLVTSIRRVRWVGSLSQLDGDFDVEVEVVRLTEYRVEVVSVGRIRISDRSGQSSEYDVAFESNGISLGSIHPGYRLLFCRSRSP